MHTRSIRRRSLAATAGLALVAGLLAVGGQSATADQANPTGTDPTLTPGRSLPIFTSTGAIIDPLDDSLPHNPNEEFIFPSLFHAGAYLKNPLAEWYIYYAPHDAPGGLNLMYSDSLDGPWTPYAQNPVISNDWEPYYSVSHVSSPDAFWNKREQTLFLYFHGENTVSRYATSADGVTFDYGGKVVTTAQVDEAQPGRHATETSYARVFEHPDPSTGYRYGMFFMTNYSDDIRRINEAFSKDGRTWELQPEPIVVPGDAEGANVSGADFWTWRGQDYIVYGSTVGTIFARTIDPALTHTGEARALFIPKQEPPEAGRAASPQIITFNGETHLFYEYGERSHTTIGHAILDPDGVRDPLNTHHSDPMYAACPAPGSDEFTGTSLDTSLWNKPVRAELDRSSVSDGELRIPTYVGNSTSAPLIQQGLPEAPWEITTKLTIDPTVNYQQAGLIARQDDANSARVDLSHVSAGQRIDFVWRHNGRDRNNAWTMEDAVMAPSDLGDSIWLRMTDHGDWMTASYSVDGQKFVNLGRAIPMDQLDAATVGPFAYRGSASTPEITAGFDWIRFTPDAAQLAACGG